MPVNFHPILVVDCIGKDIQFLKCSCSLLFLRTRNLVLLLGNDTHRPPGDGCAAGPGRPEAVPRFLWENVGRWKTCSK